MKAEHRGSVIPVGAHNFITYLLENSANRHNFHFSRQHFPFRSDAASGTEATTGSLANPGFPPTADRTIPALFYHRYVFWPFGRLWDEKGQILSRNNHRRRYGGMVVRKIDGLREKCPSSSGRGINSVSQIPEQRLE